jgi:inorganic triphosphatase YgiF
MKSRQIQEIEFKWSVRSRSDFEKFFNKLPKYVSAISSAKTIFIKDYYLDTKSRFFGQCKTSCRLRNSENRWEITLKSQSALKNGLASRQERTIPLPFFKDSPKALQHCQKEMSMMTHSQPLEILFEIHNQRTVRILTLPDKTRAELSFDEAQIGRGTHVIPLNEIELEFILGNEKAFVNFIQKMTRSTKIPPAHISKVSTALTAFHLRVDSPEPKTYPFTNFDTLGFSVRQTIRNALSRIYWLEPQVRIGFHEEAVHLFRMTFRKLRSVLGIVKKSFPPQRRKIIFSSLKRLNRRLGLLREWQVHQDTIKALFKREKTPKNIAESHMSFIELKKQALYRGLLNELNSPYYSELLRHLESIELDHNQDSTNILLRLEKKLTEKTAKETLKELQNLKAKPPEKELHSLRIQIKKLRHLCDFFKKSKNGKPSNLLKTLVQWQGKLGKIQDIRTNVQYLNRFMPSKKSALSAKKTKTAFGLLIRHLNEEKETHLRKISGNSKKIKKLKRLIKNLLD